MAEASLEAAEVAAQAGDFAGSESKYEEAIWLAESSRHDEVAVQASAQLVYAVGYVLGRSRDAERWGSYASAVLRRLGPGHDLMAGWLANNRSTLYEKEGRYQEALAMGREAVRAKIRALGEDHFDVAISYVNLATAQMQVGQIDEANEVARRAIEILIASLGPNHPTAAAAFDLRAEIMYARRDFAKAAQMCETVIAIWEREWGPDHVALAYPLTTLGEALVGLDEANKAIPPLERALKIREMFDAEPERLAKTQFALAVARHRLGLQPSARRLAEQALKKLSGNAASRGGSQAAEIERWLMSRSSPAEPLTMR